MFVEGPHKSLWAFYTVRAAVVHGFERRLGMDPAYIGADGELHVNGASSLPQRLHGGIERGGAGRVAAAECRAEDRGLERGAEPVRAAGSGRRPANVVAAGGGRQDADADQQPDGPERRCGRCG